MNISGAEGLIGGLISGVIIGVCLTSIIVALWGSWDGMIWGRKYRYFVSYAYEKGFGSTQVEAKIKTWEDVKKVNKHLEKKYGFSLVILNYQRMD